MHRFFTDNIQGNTAYLSPEDSTHAVRVLRLCEGDVICVCDGHGTEWEAKIVTADKTGVKVELSGERYAETESFFSVSLIQCLPKVGKMEVVIQKCVELGVSDFYPVDSIRCVARPDKKAAKSKVERYNKVAYEAAKQSCRGVIPVVHDYGRLSGFDFSTFDIVIIPYEEEKELTLRAFYEANKARFTDGARVAIVIGTEGGFEPSEVEYVKSCGGTSVTLGKRILRTETAGMATVAMLMGLAEG